MAGASAAEHADLLLIGTIGVPFGIKGQVKLIAITSRPEQLQKVKTVFVGAEQTQHKLQRVHEHKHNQLILTLQGVTDRNAAEELRGAEVFIRASDAAPLDEDEYFLHDLPGLHVETVSGDAIGIVKDVLETGANDVLVVERLTGKEVLIPMIHDVVKLLDIPAQRLVIELLPGLFEE